MHKILTMLVILAASSCKVGGLPNFTDFSDYRNGASTTPENILEGVALNATAADRTITLVVAGFTKLRVYVFFTYAAATTVVATPTCSYDETSYVSVTSRAVSAGAGTVSVYADTYTTNAADADIGLEYDVTGCVKFKIVFSGASAGASDLIDVQAVATVGGG